jgi:hypothetical protein
MLAEFLQQHDPQHKHLAEEMLKFYDIAALAVQLEKYYGKVSVCERVMLLHCMMAMLHRAAFLR